MVIYKHLLTTIFMGINLAYASEISYDMQNITPQTWQEVDMEYVHKINGKDYTEQAHLLRPTLWLEQYNLNKVGRLLEVHESDVGIDALVKVVAIKPNKLYFESRNYQNAHPVIGTFLKYSDDVWSYTFTNGETIEATSNHPFYDVEQQKYIPIGDIKLNGDHLLTDDGARVQLASKTKHNKGVETVYNFEVYQAHNYYVSQKVAMSSLLVHNKCDLPDHKIRFLEEYGNTTVKLSPADPTLVTASIEANENFFDEFPDGSLDFSMDFSPDKWEFVRSYREYDRGRDTVYASDITKYLVFRARAQFPDIVTVTPRIVVRYGVQNLDALSSLANLGEKANGSPEFLKVFLKKTPNGKHTQRVLEDFGLSPISAKFVDFDYTEYLKTKDIKEIIETGDYPNIEVKTTKFWRPWL